VQVREGERVVSAKSRRCTGCDVNWPDTTAYATCPGCGCDTWGAADALYMKPLAAAEAKQLAADLTLSRQRHEEFEQFYADREAKRLRAELDQFAGSS
jgi:hypothetical protein